MRRSFSKNTVNDIESKINPDTVSLFRNLLSDSNVIEFLQSYSLVITGTIGAGKSTICESLSYLFHLCNIDTNDYPEFLFVDDELSHTILEKKISGNISTLTFQSYVLDNWTKILESNKNRKALNLFERCVDDSVLCFCNIANKNNDLNDLQLMSLYSRLKEINAAYSLPSYFDPNLHFTEIISSDLNFNLRQILEITINDVKNNVHSRIIGLSVSTFDSKSRICARNRMGESGYSDEIINTYNTHYKKLYKFLNKHRQLNRYVDIGKLI